MAHDFDFDVIVVGSGFGGSVSALRLVEKGYRVAVLEAGRRFDTRVGRPGERHAALPKTSWRAFRYLWAPGLGMRGIQRIHLLRGERGSRVLVLAGTGVGGGGSLVYANTAAGRGDRRHNSYGKVSPGDQMWTITSSGSTLAMSPSSEVSTAWPRSPATRAT
jgi:choline dehydrogenase-like flavoprotein